MEELWLRSANHDAAFAPDPVGFLTQLLAVQDLRFEFRPLDAAPKVAIFNARGLDRHLSTLERACDSLRASSTLRKAFDRKKGIERDIVFVADEVFKEAVVDELPEMLSGPPLQYPELLWRAGIQGRVIVQAIIDTLGRAEPPSVTIIQSPHAGFDQPATTYVLGALFRPARVHGRAVRVLVNIPIDFKIRRRP